MSEDKFAAAKEAVNKLKHESVKTVFTDHLTFVYDNPGEDDVALNVQLKRVSRYCSNLSSSGTELDLMLQQIYNSQEVTQNSKALKVASNSSDVEGMSVGAPAVGDRRDRNDLAEDAASQAPLPCTNESQYCKEVAASLNARHSEIQVFINEAQPNRLQALLKRMFTANTGWASIWNEEGNFPKPLGGGQDSKSQRTGNGDIVVDDGSGFLISSDTGAGTKRPLDGGGDAIVERHRSPLVCMLQLHSPTGTLETHGVSAAEILWNNNLRKRILKMLARYGKADEFGKPETTRCTEAFGDIGRFELELILMDLSRLGFSPSDARQTHAEAIKDDAFVKGGTVLEEHQAISRELKNLSEVCSKLNIKFNNENQEPFPNLEGKWLAVHPELPGRYVANGDGPNSKAIEAYLTFALVETLEWKKIRAQANSFGDNTCVERFERLGSSTTKLAMNALANAMSVAVGGHLKLNNLLFYKAYRTMGANIVALCLAVKEHTEAMAQIHQNAVEELFAQESALADELDLKVLDGSTLTLKKSDVVSYGSILLKQRHNRIKILLEAVSQRCSDFTTLLRELDTELKEAEVFDELFWAAPDKDNGWAFLLGKNNAEADRLLPTNVISLFTGMVEQKDNSGIDVLNSATNQSRRYKQPFDCYVLARSTPYFGIFHAELIRRASSLNELLTARRIEIRRQAVSTFDSIAKDTNSVLKEGQRLGFFGSSVKPPTSLSDFGDYQQHICFLRNSSPSPRALLAIAAFGGSCVEKFNEAQSMGSGKAGFPESATKLKHFFDSMLETGEAARKLLTFLQRIQSAVNSKYGDQRSRSAFIFSRKTAGAAPVLERLVSYAREVSDALNVKFICLLRSTNSYQDWIRCSFGNKYEWEASAFDLIRYVQDVLADKTTGLYTSAFTLVSTFATQGGEFGKEAQDALVFFKSLDALGNLATNAEEANTDVQYHKNDINNWLTKCNQHRRLLCKSTLSAAMAMLHDDAELSAGTDAFDFIGFKQIVKPCR